MKLYAVIQGIEDLRRRKNYTILECLVKLCVVSHVRARESCILPERLMKVSVVNRGTVQLTCGGESSTIPGRVPCEVVREVKAFAGEMIIRYPNTF